MRGAREQIQLRIRICSRNADVAAAHAAADARAPRLAELTRTLPVAMCLLTRCTRMLSQSIRSLSVAMRALPEGSGGCQPAPGPWRCARVPFRCARGLCRPARVSSRPARVPCRTARGPRQLASGRGQAESGPGWPTCVRCRKILQAVASHACPGSTHEPACGRHASPVALHRDGVEAVLLTVGCDGFAARKFRRLSACTRALARRTLSCSPDAGPGRPDEGPSRVAWSGACWNYCHAAGRGQPATQQCAPKWTIGCEAVITATPALRARHPPRARPPRSPTGQ